jgi:NADPH:quinone reductase
MMLRHANVNNDHQMPAQTIAVPQTIRAVSIDRYGGPEVLAIQSLPVPIIGAREILIALDTAGVGGWDTEMRIGWSSGGSTRFPLVLGTDGAGTVAAVG